MKQWLVGTHVRTTAKVRPVDRRLREGLVGTVVAIKPTKRPKKHPWVFVSFEGRAGNTIGVIAVASHWLETL